MDRILRIVVWDLKLGGRFVRLPAPLAVISRAYLIYSLLFIAWPSNQGAGGLRNGLDLYSIVLRRSNLLQFGGKLALLYPMLGIGKSTGLV